MEDGNKGFLVVYSEAAADGVCLLLTYRDKWRTAPQQELYICTAALPINVSKQPKLNKMYSLICGLCKRQRQKLLLNVHDI